MELDPVTQKFLADDTAYLAALDEMVDAAKVWADETIAQIAKVQAALDGLQGRDIDVKVNMTGVDGTVAGGAGSGAAAAAAAAGVEDLARADAAQAAAAGVAADADKAQAGALLEVAAASQIAKGSMIESAAAADVSAAAATRAWRPWFLFGNNWQTALHWIVAGGAELLAVTVPALIALGAGAFVAMQGAQNMANHMQAVWTAFEAGGPAVGKTMGDFLGLGHAFQSAQDAANPGVYEILGSAINDAKVKAADFAQTGLGVVHMLDEFSARVTVDFQNMAKSGEFQSLLGAMIPDLQELGQVFGNLGHAVLNFAAAMPGLAELLLKIADGASRVILALSSLPTGLIMSAMALEEFYRWGGLALSVLARMAGAGALMKGFAGENAGFIVKFGSALKALGMQAAAGIANLGGLIGEMAKVTGAGEEAGAAIESFGESMGTSIAAMSPLAMAGIAGLVAAIAIGIVAISRIKDATDSWVASTDRAVAQASDLNVLPKISQTLAANQIKLADATQRTTSLLKDQGTQTAMVSARFGDMNGETQRAAQDAMDLTTQQQQLIGTARTVGTNIGNLATAFHVSAAGALALANAAGVNLQVPMTRTSEAMKIAVQQVKNLETGLGAMGAPAGMIGADMQALGVQSQLAGTKVQQVNQSLDAFIAGTTGGMTGVAQFAGALHQMGSDAQSSSVGINGAINSISRNATSMGFTLQGMGVKAQQSWQQFSSAVQQGNSVLDTMRTAMAEGAIGPKQLETAIKDVGGSMLPFAAHSKTALAIVSQFAQEAGFPATTSLKQLARDFGITGNAASNQLTRGVEKAVIGMSNLNQVARNLSATVSSQLDSAMAGAIIKSSALGQKTLDLANAIHKYGANSPQAAAAQKSLNTAQGIAQKLTQEVAQGFNKEAAGADKVASSTGRSATATGQAASQVSKHVGEVTKQVSALGRASGALAQQVGAADRNTSAVSRNTSGVGRASSALTQQTGAVDRNTGAANTGTGAQDRHATAVQRVGSQARTSASALNALHTATGGASSAAAGATGRMAQLSVSEGRVGTSAYNAAAAVRQLAAAINSLHDKTVHVTTVTSTTAAHAAGTMSAAPGLALVGEQGPELMVMGGGERIYPAGQTASMLAAMAGAGSAGGGGHVGEVHVHSHAYLDGKEVFNSVRTESYKFQTRNAGARTGLMIPGNKVGSA